MYKMICLLAKFLKIPSAVVRLVRFVVVIEAFFIAPATLSFAQEQLRYSHYPAGVSLPPPVWIEPLPQRRTHTYSATQDYRITPVQGLKNLAVTFIYEDTTRFGNFIRVSWKSNKNAVLLCNNLREGSGYINKRTLLLDSTQLISPGILSIESSTSHLGITSVYFVWVTSSEVFVPADESPDVQLLTETGEIYNFGEISGQATSSPEEYYNENPLHGDLVSVPILDTPIAISKANSLFEFTFLGETPAIARLSVEINGLESFSDVEIFLNGQSIGSLAVEAPDLREIGYQWTIPDKLSKNAQLSYVGWREGTFLFPGQLLKQGKNQLHFRATNSHASVVFKTIAIKNLMLQVKYKPLHWFSSKRESSGKLFESLPDPTDIKQIFQADDSFDPLPVVEPYPEVHDLIFPTPLRPGKNNDINTNSQIPFLRNTG